MKESEACCLLSFFPHQDKKAKNSALPDQIIKFSCFALEI